MAWPLVSIISGLVECEWLSDGQIRLTSPVVGIVNGAPWIVPSGFVSDGATIPRLAWRVAGHPFSRRILRPAIIHDAGYELAVETPSLDRYPTRLDVDRAFYSLLRYEGVGWARAHVMYAAVRAGGRGYWDEPEPEEGDE